MGKSGRIQCGRIQLAEAAASMLSKLEACEDTVRIIECK
jgi:hypothetical protein